MKKSLITLVASLILLTGCSTSMDSNVVTSGSSAGKVVYGTIASSREVTIKDSKDLSGNAIGGIGGGVAGGIAGSSIGKGKGSDIATVGGVLAGAVLGALIEDQLSTSKGYEYIIQLDVSQSVNTNPVKEKNTTHVTTTKNMIEEDIKSSATMTDVAVNSLSIVQEDETPIPNGTRVMIIYRDDSTRVVPSTR